jgi:two-component system, NarL family, nitrate/nitrite response regulator NarL
MAKAESLNKNIGQPRIRLLLIDDNAIFLQSLSRLVATDATLAEVGTATTAQEGLTLAQDLRPDIVIVDLRMPGMSGLEFIPLVRSQMPELCILAMSLLHEEEIKRAALKRGAHAFIRKDEMFEKLRPVLHELYNSGCSQQK